MNFVYGVCVCVCVCVCKIVYFLVSKCWNGVKIVSDIAVFVLTRDVKLQPTSQPRRQNQGNTTTSPDGVRRCPMMFSVSVWKRWVTDWCLAGWRQAIASCGRQDSKTPLFGTFANNWTVEAMFTRTWRVLWESFEDVVYDLRTIANQR